LAGSLNHIKILNGRSKTNIKYLKLFQFLFSLSQYIDYKSLKNKIKELKILQDRELHELSPTHLRLDQIDNFEDLEMLNGEGTGLTWAEHLQDELKGKSESQKRLIKQKFVAVGRYINKFLSELDGEVKKFFHFYLQLEKEIRREFFELKKQISELSNVDNIKQVLSVIESIDQVADKIINVCQYININITAIRKILKKFDKKFETKDNPVALHYLKQNLSKSNSSLVYILQFKIVDEASALLDRMINSLEKSFFKKIKYQEEQESEEDILLQEPLLLREINLEELSGADIHKNILKMIQKKFTKIKAKLEKIDDSNNLIRSGIEVWSLIIKSNIRVVDDYFKSKAAVKRSTQADIQGIILEKLTPQVQREEEYHLSLQSKINLLIVLSHTFVYTMNCYIVQPTNGLYVAELGANKTLSGLIMGLTHLAAIFCTFLYSYWTNFSYKFPLLISCICFILGNFFYAFADYEKSLLIMGLGRFLIGFASARVVNRRYIIDQVPKQLIMFFSLLYVGLTCLGMAAGPFVALFLLHFFPTEYIFFEMRFNNMTNPGWFCLVLWLIFTLFILFAFKDPDEGEATTSSSSPIQSQTQSMRTDSLINSNNGPVIKLEESKNAVNPGSNALTSANTNMFEHDIQEIIHEQESTYSYMNIAFTILILVLLVIRVRKFFMI
jgi:MFS family permease